jgi:hypothetical protein
MRMGVSTEACEGQTEKSWTLYHVST